MAATGGDDKANHSGGGGRLGGASPSTDRGGDHVNHHRPRDAAAADDGDDDGGGDDDDTDADDDDDVFTDADARDALARRQIEATLWRVLNDADDAVPLLKTLALGRHRFHVPALQDALFAQALVRGAARSFWASDADAVARLNAPRHAAMFAIGRGRHLGDALSARLSEWRFGGALDPRVGWDALRHVLWRGAAHLRVLDVSGCGLAGALPLGILQLKVGGCAVDLSSNAGLTLPDDIGELGPEITELDLYNCSLVGTVPPGIGRCVGLRELRLHFNGLTGVAPEIGRCTRLVGLDLSVNALRSAPVAAIAGSLSRLENISLWKNRLADPARAKAELEAGLKDSCLVVT